MRTWFSRANPIDDRRGFRPTPTTVDQITFPGGYGGYAQKTRALIDATYIVGLRKAGMPEE